MKHKYTINLVGGTITLAMSLVVASVSQHAWADDMTQPVAAGAVEQAPDAIALQAIFMDVQGKVRWRIDQNAPWTEAKVNDLLNAGAEIRTGLKSRSTLRVGKNATILVDSGTTFQLPEMVQEGQTLRTLATVKSGRADFKVDHVGFANDFKVVTPQTTLSVRGTGFALASGPLKGVDISGANSNTMNAIEVKYIAANIAYFVSGQGKTSSESGRQDPVQNAWVSTIGPPPIAGTMVSQSDVQQQVAQGIAGANPSSNIQQIQQTQAGQANENAIDTALILASDSSGGDQNSDVYMRYQTAGAASTLTTSILQSANQNIQKDSSAQLENFNGNFNVYESGDWQKSLLGLNRLWYGSEHERANHSFSSKEMGVGGQLQMMQTIAFNDWTSAQRKLESMNFDSRSYFIDENSRHEFRTDSGHVALDVITQEALRNGQLLNGAEGSLLTLKQNWNGERGTDLWIAQTLNVVVQAEFGKVETAYQHLKWAKEALHNLKDLDRYSQSNSELLNLELVKMNTFLGDLKGLIAGSTSEQSARALSVLTELATTSAMQVEAGLSAANAAMANFRNASSRGTQALFLAQAANYRSAVDISVQSMAYLTKVSEDGGSDGIAVLAAKIQQSFNLANAKFDYQSFVNFAQPHVLEAQSTSKDIQDRAASTIALATVAQQDFAEGTDHYNAIVDQVSQMTAQVNLMHRKTGLVYMGGSEGNTVMKGMAGFELKSLEDLTSSNESKSKFDDLFNTNASHRALKRDLGNLKELNDLYSGVDSIQNQAVQLVAQIGEHNTLANGAVSSINDLTRTYTTNVNNAVIGVNALKTSFTQQFADSRATANRYLNDFTTIVGSNNSDVARTALAAVETLVGDHNTYVTQAEAAVANAEAASRKASSRGEMVYMNAVATQMARAATIQLAANTAMLNVATNGGIIQANYSQAQSDYNLREENDRNNGSK
jgi:hypothetical protein